MLGAYGSVALICGASLIVGQAILSLSGRRDWTYLAGPVGLAALVTVAGIAIKLPGHGVAVAVAEGVLLLAAMAVLWIRRRDRKGPGAGGLLAGLLALAGASIPFIASGRIGVLGVGLVNDDMASHLWIADWLDTRVGQMPPLVHQGYPVGPHGLVDGLAHVLASGLIDVFAGLTLAIPVLIAMVAWEALGGCGKIARVGAAAVTALPYLAAAYLAQEAFKEPIEALFVLSFALLLPAVRTARAAIPLGVIAAGAVYVYSFPGLFWLAGTAIVFMAIRALGLWPAGRVGTRPPDDGVPPAEASEPQAVHAPPSRRRPRRGEYRRPAAAAGLVVVILAILTAPDWGRIAEFGHFRAFSPSEANAGGLGNFHQQLSPLEALGIWPTSEFRLTAGQGSLPAAAFYLGALLGAVGLGLGLPRWVRRHGPAVPAALATAIVIYVAARAFGTVYTSGKALAILSPFVMLLALGGLALRPDAGVRRSEASERQTAHAPSSPRRLSRGGYRRPDGLLAVVLLVAAALSSFVILRQAPVGPQTHMQELATIRPLVQGQSVLFLGRDNFVSYELRGARPYTAVRNYYDPNYVDPDFRLHDVFSKFDFDSVTPHVLQRFRYVITTRGAYASGPPPAYRPVVETPDYVLWKRRGKVGPRNTLQEGDQPGAIFDCAGSRARGLVRAGGRATAFARPPVTAGAWSPSSVVENGAHATASLELPRGRWEISLQYDASRPVTLSGPGFDATLPANLDYRGPSPYWPAGKLTVSHRESVTLSASVEPDPLVGRLLGAQSVADLAGMAASPAGKGGPIPGEAESSLPLSRACGRYVDWFTSRR